MTLADGSDLPLVADLNAWSAGDGVTVPHAGPGAVKSGTDPDTVYMNVDSAGQTAMDLGAEGRNVDFLDGSVRWKNIGEMSPHSIYGGGGNYTGCW